VSLADELEALAAGLRGSGWRTTHPSVWTAEEQAAFDAASDDEKRRYVAEDVLRLARELGGGALSLAVFYHGQGLLIRQYVGVDLTRLTDGPR
jgi:hypothetical protein